MTGLKPRQQLLRFLVCTLVLVLLPTTTSARPAGQPGAIDEAGLEVHIAFPNDQLQAEWHVRVKRTLHGAVVFERTAVMRLRCELHGDVQIQDESALFRAVDQSYIACELPSLRETVYAMTKKEPGGPIVLNQQCDCKNAWVAAKVKLESPTTAGGQTLHDNPLFYHPNFQYYVPLTAGPHDPLLHVQYDGVTQPFSGVFAPEDWNVLWTGIDGAEFLANLGPWGDYFADYELTKLPDAHHWANGASLRDAVEPSEFQLTTDATVIYIGHNPVLGTYSDLVVNHLDWDPPCFGSGGG
jgi:hypothetical protein